jgi:hypothetical protein
MTLGNRVFLIGSAPAGLAGWGLGLWLSGRFDRLLRERRIHRRATAERQA